MMNGVDGCKAISNLVPVSNQHAFHFLQRIFLSCIGVMGVSVKRSPFKL
jgi:hypothetical protein